MRAEVFQKLVSFLRVLPATAIPPLVLQLLQFVKHSQSLSRDLLNIINEFFSTRLCPGDRDGSVTNTNLDSIELDDGDDSREREELTQAESTVIYHLNKAASSGHAIGKEVAHLAKAGGQAPDLLLQPFALFLSLTFVSLKQYQEPILGSLKSAIIQAISMEDARQNYVWTRNHMKKLSDIGDLLSLVISQSKKSGGWDLITEGVLDLGLCLLDVQTSSKADFKKVKTINHIGARLLSKLIKKQSSSCSLVISALTDKILTTNVSNVQYTEALRIVVADTSTILMETPHVMDELVENVARLPFNTSRRALYALLPLVKLSRVLRDDLIIALRKLLFCSSTDARQAATSGVLLLLKTFRISTSRSVSQLSQTQGSGSLSQVAVDVQRGGRMSNEALCLELLGVLRRCFMQSPEVKMVFYSGVMEVVNKNPELCEGVLEVAYTHLLYLWGPEGSSRQRWQLNLDKIGREANDSWELEEPVGWFLNCLQQITSKTQQVTEGDNEILDKVTKLLEEMVEKYGNCEPGELGFDETDNFDKKTVAGERKVLQLEQLKGLLESLMEYIFCHGADYDISKADLLLGLFKTYNSLTNVMAASLQRQKAKKGEKGKKVDKKDTTHDSSGESSKIPTGKYVPPQHCLSLKFVSIALSALLMDSAPSHQEPLNKLRDCEQFVHFVLDALTVKLRQICSNLSVNGDEGVQTDSDFKFLINILNTLFSHAMRTENPLHEAQRKVTSILFDCLQMLLTYFPRRKLLVISALTDDSLARKEGVIDTFLEAAMKQCNDKIQHYLGRLEDPDEEDIPQKLSSCLNIFKLLLEEIVEDTSVWKIVRQINDNVVTDDITVLKANAGLLFYSILKCVERSDFAINMSKKIHYLSGDLDTTVRLEQVDACPWVTDDNKYLLLPQLLGFIEEQLGQAEMSLTWLRSMSGFVDTAHRVFQTETALTFILAKQVNALSELIKTSIPVGSATDSVLKLLQRLYTITGSLTKHFINRTKQRKDIVSQTNFASLIELMNRTLTRDVFNFVSYIDNERSSKNKEEAAKRHARNKAMAPDVLRAKVLRESKIAVNLNLKIELLDSDLIKLGKKVKLKLCEGLRMQNRDFKLRLERLAPDSGEESSDEDGEEDPDETGDNNKEDEVNVSKPLLHSTAMGDITNSSLPSPLSLNSIDEGPRKKKMKK